MAIMSLNSHLEEREEIVYSSYQTNFFKAVEQGKDNLILEAVAGSGKTTTIVHACTLIEPRERSIFVAFNKSIADELARKVPACVEARTLHSLGLSILRDNNKKVKVDARMVSKALWEILRCKTSSSGKRFYYDYGRDVQKIIGRLKALAVVDIDNNMVEDMIFSMDLDIVGTVHTHSIIQKLWWECTKFDGEENPHIDFDDMIYLAVTRPNTMPQYDNVIVDEAQDLNKTQREFLSLILAPGGRLIAVGDTKQSIYGFRGADHNSMGNIKKEFGCRELPLSISYRCSKAVVTLAKNFVPHIEHRDNAPDGVVGNIYESDLRFMVQQGDYILCRTWAPLMKQAMKLSLVGNNVCILGNDIVPMINKLAKDIFKNYGSISNGDIWDHFALLVCGLPEGQEWKQYAIKDRCSVLSYIVGNDQLSAKDVEGVLKEIFTDKPPVTPHIMLSTIHKAKGLEADRVFILRPDLLPHPLAKGHNELIQEENLHYVAITRAKESLYYITEDDQ